MPIGSMISAPNFGYRSIVGERDAEQFNPDEAAPARSRPDNAVDAQLMYNDLVERFAAESAYTANGICGTLSVWDLIHMSETQARRCKSELDRQVLQTRCAINVLSGSEGGADRTNDILTEISEMHYGRIILEEMGLGQPDRNC